MKDSPSHLNKFILRILWNLGSCRDILGRIFGDAKDDLIYQVWIPGQNLGLMKLDHPRSRGRYEVLKSGQWVPPAILQPLETVKKRHFVT
jgi:hypothetical protein